jgi:hypothetical protein
MGSSISISDRPEDIWLANNATAHWLADLLKVRCNTDQELNDQLTHFIVSNGLSLDLLAERQPTLAIRIRDAFSVVAAEIVAGIHKKPPAQHTLNNAVFAETQRHFGELIRILERFNPPTSVPSS